jgi:outer membrane receptor protein involved in Fe transport
MESGTGIPLEAATIRLFSEKDSSLASGSQSDVNGFYIIEGISFGRYRMVASMVGHNSVTVKGVMITRKNPEYIADTIYLKSGETTTEEIEVNAERSIIEFRDDKKVYNVENSILSKGGNATDLLRRIPSVEVDQDGNISLRGSSKVKFMIDGKMVRQNATAILEQTPAGSIESVEIISNPGSKYEAEGEVGMINIVLKKGNELIGYSGQLSLGAGSSDKYNAGLSLAKKNSKLNIYGNYDLRDVDNKMNGGGLLTNYYTSDPKYIEESTSALMKNTSHLFKAGTDFYLSPQTTFGLVASYLFRDRNSSESTLNENLDENGQVIYNEQTNSSEGESGNAFDASISFNKILSAPKNVLTGEATIGFNNEDEDLTSVTQELDAFMNPLNNTPDMKNSLNSENVFGGSIQFDLVQPLSSAKKTVEKKGKGPGKGDDSFRQRGKNSDGIGPRIETGIKYNYRDLESIAKGEVFDYQTNSYINDTTVTNNFNYLENILGGYATYGDKFGSLDMVAGVRGEYTNTTVDDASTDTMVGNNYFDLFPSLNLSYNLTMTDKFQASYSRRINRPDARFLVPFVDNANPTNLRTGNPDLKPEYTNAVQLSYLKFLQGFTINPTVYYRHTSDAITRYKIQLDSVTTLSTFENLDKIDAYGAELILGYQGNKNLFVNASANYSYNKLTGSNSTDGLDNSGELWTAKLNAGFTIWYDIDIQVAYNYQGKRPSILGYTEPFSTFEAGLRKDFLNEALTVGLRFSDIFNKQQFNTNIESDTFSQNMYRKRESRFAFITITYNFGAKEVKQKKKRESDDNRTPDIDF